MGKSAGETAPRPSYFSLKKPRPRIWHLCAIYVRIFHPNMDSWEGGGGKVETERNAEDRNVQDGLPLPASSSDCLDDVTRED